MLNLAVHEMTAGH